MKTRIAIWNHKDGDHLAVVQIPWWTPLMEWFANRFCPCCGVTGLIARWEPAETVLYRFWNWLLGQIFTREKTLYKVPIRDGCEAYRAIYDPHGTCWRDGCEYCWEDREDAHHEPATE